jgi:predicted negative regulator of RcsB-dependent stress response
VLLALGEHDRAARAALDGAAAAETVGAALWAARCRVVGGDALACAGDAAGARTVLRRAAATARRAAPGAFGTRRW